MGYYRGMEGTRQELIHQAEIASQEATDRAFEEDLEAGRDPSEEELEARSWAHLEAELAARGLTLGDWEASWKAA